MVKIDLDIDIEAVDFVCRELCGCNPLENCTAESLEDCRELKNKKVFGNDVIAILTDYQSWIEKQLKAIEKKYN